MNCIQCGAPLGPNSKFCPRCGAPAPTSNPTNNQGQNGWNDNYQGQNQNGWNDNYQGQNQNGWNDNYQGQNQNGWNDNYQGQNQNGWNDNYQGQDQNGWNDNYQGQDQNGWNDNYQGQDQNGWNDNYQGQNQNGWNDNYQGQDQNGWNDNYQGQDQNGWNQNNWNPDPVPKKKLPIPLLATVGVLAVVVVLVVVNFGKVSNMVMRTFASPEKYYSYVESKEIKSAVDDLTNLYARQVTDNAMSDERTVESNATLTIDDTLLSMLELYSGTDFDWLSSIHLTQTYAMKDGNLGADLSLSLGSGSSLDMSMILSEDQTIYFQIPAINEQYAKITSEDLSYYGLYGEDYYTMMTLLSALDQLPDDQLLNKLGIKYLTLIADHITDVDKGNTKITADGVEQNCTILTVNISSEDIHAMVVDLCEEALKDDDLEDLIYELSPLLGYSGNYLYTEFTDELQYMQMYSDASYYTSIGMDVYVAASGEVVGRSLYLYDENVTMTYLAPRSGSERGLELTIREGGYTVLQVSGSIKNGDGTFLLVVDEETLCEVDVTDFDKGKLEKGYLKGTFVITPMGYAQSEMNYYLSSFSLSGAQIAVTLDQSKNSSKETIDLLLNGQSYVTLDAETSQSKSAKVNIPSNATDVESWVYGISETDLLNILTSLGIPMDILYELF